MRLDIYNHAINTGASPRLAEMLACQSAPAVKGDEFRRLGVEDPLEGVHPEMRPYYINEAKKAGVSLSGKKYLASLAERPGDPRAYVDSYSDAKKIVEERGWSAGGRINVKQDHDCHIGLPEKLPISDEVVEERAMDIMQADGCEGTCTVSEWDDAKDKALSTLKPQED